MTIGVLAVTMAAIGLAGAIAVAVVIYRLVRGDFIAVSEPVDGDEPASYLAAVFASFARISQRTRRTVRVLSVALAFDLFLSGGFGYLLVRYEQSRCVPYQLISNTNAGIRDFLGFSYSRAESPAAHLTPEQRAQLARVQAQEDRDFPPVHC